MDYDTAKQLFEFRCPYGGKFPYERRDTFVQVIIPISELYLNEAARRGEWRSEVSRVRVMQMMDIPTHHPIWAAFLTFNGQIWKPHHNMKVRVVDGHHRTIAKIRRGITSTQAFLPQQDYDVYLNCR